MLPLPNLIALGIILSVCLFFILRRDRISEDQRRWFRYAVAGLLIVNELAWHVWNIWNGSWSIQTTLPLNICSLMVFASAWMLARKSAALYEYLYFLGIGGASWALLTPDQPVYGFPHYLFFQTYLSHGMIVVAAVYMTMVEGFRPRPISLLKVAVGTNLYMACVGLVDYWIGANYMFLAGKPAVPSLLDYLGPWPWYILGMEVVGVLIAGLLYLPFYLKDHTQRNSSKHAA